MEKPGLTEYIEPLIYFHKIHKKLHHEVGPILPILVGLSFREHRYMFLPKYPKLGIRCLALQVMEKTIHREGTEAAMNAGMRRGGGAGGVSSRMSCVRG